MNLDPGTGLKRYGGISIKPSERYSFCAALISGSRLLTTQTFRNLFRSQVIEATEGIGVRDLTLLFTDLKGSTELYDRIGDLNAYSQVQRHFERCGRTRICLHDASAEVRRQRRLELRRARSGRNPPGPQYFGH